MNESRSLSEFLMTHKEKEPVSFHTPGHKGKSTLYNIYGYGGFVRGVMGSDLTEIPGADNLQQPEGLLRKVMEQYAGLYGVRHSALLVNGSSVGLIAAVLSAVPRGGKLLMGRNSHKSVFSALRLGGIAPVYVAPEIDPDTGLQCGTSPRAIEDALIRHPDVDAVLITSPNYYGVLSDVGWIADLVHLYGKPLIVDQAHGAHLKFFDYLADSQRAAENCGADLTVNSTHKTLLSFTGSAVLNVCSERIDVEAISSYLAMLQTTSPSYLLLGSLDINQRILRQDGVALIRRWQEDLDYFYDACRSVDGLELIERDDLDRTKISVSLRRKGIEGNALQEALIARGIWPEMVHGDYVMLMSGLGNERGDYEDLLQALHAISAAYTEAATLPESVRLPQTEALSVRELPAQSETIPLYRAEGRALYDALVPYPPGVPLICPGEVMTYELIAYLQERMRCGESILGIDEEGSVRVGIEEK